MTEYPIIPTVCEKKIFPPNALPNINVINDPKSHIVNTQLSASN